jgi:hypothetical protein
LQAKDAKACLRIDYINVAVVPDKIGNPNGMQIIFEQNEQMRCIYVYADSGQVPVTLL